MLAFFGLTPIYRMSLFSMITEICYFGKGGYNFDMVYDMPIWLRKFTYNQIISFQEKQAEAYSGNKSSDNKSSIDLSDPNAKDKIPPKYKVPSYVTKASKK
jgi:hypothetical protein